MHTLELMWNSLGDEGTFHLGQALRSNRSITCLDVTHNEIGQRGERAVSILGSVHAD